MIKVPCVRLVSDELIEIGGRCCPPPWGTHREPPQLGLPSQPVVSGKLFGELAFLRPVALPLLPLSDLGPRPRLQSRLGGKRVRG